MKAFLKKYWWIFGIVGLVVVALVIWRAWPKSTATKRKITFFDLPIISGDSGNPPATGSGNEPATVTDSNDNVDDLLNQAIADYDHA